MANFLFLNGRIRALESKLLDVGRLDRMIGAETPNDAFRVLVELQYADYFDEKTKASDFDEIVHRGLLETKEMLVESTNDFVGFKFLWTRFDINNLKRAAKLKLLDGETEVEDFSDENGFSSLGDFSKEEVENAVFRNEFSKKFPAIFVKALGKIDQVYEEKNDFREVEFILDRALFDYLSKVKTRTMSSYFRKLFRFMVNAANMRTLARAVLVVKEELPDQAFIPYGSFKIEEIKAIKNYEDLAHFLKATEFISVLEKIKEQDSDVTKMLKIEKEIDVLYAKFMREETEDGISSAQIPVNYFERRLQNSRMIKFVMFAKFHGMDSEKIYNTLKTF